MKIIRFPLISVLIAVCFSVALVNAMDDGQRRQPQSSSSPIESMRKDVQELPDKLRTYCGNLVNYPRQFSGAEQLIAQAWNVIDQMSNCIASFNAADRNNDTADAESSYQALRTLYDSLVAIGNSLREIRKSATSDRGSSTAGRLSGASIPAIMSHAVQSSRIARTAHLSPVPRLGQQRHSIHFNPHQLSPGGLNGLPLSLHQLPGVQILYYPFPNLPVRVAGTCGTCAIGNALAIRDAVLSGSLNAITVFHNATQHDDLNSHSGTSLEEAIDLALAVRLENFNAFYFVEKYPDPDGRIKENPFSIVESSCYNHPRLMHSVNLYKEDSFQAQVVQKIRNSSTIIAYFLCCIDVEQPADHGVLITIVKQEGKISMIIYMDCNNNPVLDQSKSAAFIHYLYLQCIAPY